MWDPKYKIGEDVQYLLPSGEWSEEWTITRIDLQDRTYQAVHFPSGDYVEDVHESDIRRAQQTVTVPRALLVKCDDAVRHAYSAASNAFRYAKTTEQRAYAIRLHDRLMDTERLIREALASGDTR